MARIRQSEELLAALKARQAKEDKEKAQQEAKEKAAEKERKKALVVAKQEQLKGKSTQKRKKARDMEKGISIPVPTCQTPKKKAKLTDKGKGKVKLVKPVSHDSDSDSLLGHQQGDISGVPTHQVHDQVEPVEVGPTMDARNRHAPKKPKQSWEEFINGKGFKAERFIKATAFNHESQVIKVLTKRGLGVWMSKGKGFKSGIVRKFYSVAMKDATSDIITARMSLKKTVKVTPDLIAKFLNIERPSATEIEYSQQKFKSPGRHETMTIIFTNPAPPKDDGSTYPIGYMHPEYATINKLIHYNLYARGCEGAPKQDEVDLLIKFMGDAVLDVASLIFEDIVQFICERSNRLMPFPQLITQLCIDQRITSAESYIFGEGGINPVSSSVRPMARDEVARSPHATLGLKSHCTSSTSAPQTAPCEPTIIDMLHAIQSQLNSHEERMKKFETSVYNDFQTLHAHTAPCEPSIIDMLHGIQSQLNNHEERFNIFEQRVYNDLQTLDGDMKRILRRQEFQWNMQLIQQDRMTQMADRFRATPFPPIPPEYWTEFGYPSPPTESNENEDEIVVRDKDAATTSGKDKDSTIDDRIVDPAIPPK